MYVPINLYLKEPKKTTPKNPYYSKFFFFSQLLATKFLSVSFWPRLTPQITHVTWPLSLSSLSVKVGTRLSQNPATMPFGPRVFGPAHSPSFTWRPGLAHLSSSCFSNLPTWFQLLYFSPKLNWIRPSSQLWLRIFQWDFLLLIFHLGICKPPEFIIRNTNSRNQDGRRG